MLLALTNQGMVAVGGLAGLFIVFAALSAFYFPRRSPDFPGNRLGLFAVVTVLLFAGTMAGMVFFAKEEDEAHAEATAGEAEAGPAASTAVETATAPATPTGDSAAGSAVFASAGCGGCHTLDAAGSSGAVGPNLDDAKPAAELVVDRVTHGKGVMPSFDGDLDEKQIQDVAAYVVASTQG